VYAIVLGPMVWVSLIVFLLGTGFQIVRFYTLTRKAGPGVLSASPRRVEDKPRRPLTLRLQAILQQLKYSLIAVHPFPIAVSAVFHLCLLIVPLFLLGHNALIANAVGMALPSIPDALSDALTVTVLLCCLFFLLRRLFLARVRALSSVYDYVVLALATVPFLSGFLAYHQLFDLDYRTLMIIHMLSGELMIMAIPFTKLTHMIFFFLNRFLIVNEHTLGQGSRVWAHRRSFDDQPHRRWPMILN
jgi:nitrate reductase gamma subunit